MRRINVAWLFPRLLNTYSDAGNIAAVRRRCALRNIEAQIFRLDSTEALQCLDPDLIVLGGAQDRDEAFVSRDLADNARAMRSALARGSVLFAVCAGYQLLGNSYETSGGKIVEGLHLLDMHTVAGQKRWVGYAAVQTMLPGVGMIVGFENHAGCTYLGPGLKPLGSVSFGFGNNGCDGFEGAVSGTVIATYLHGPVLIANPLLTDFIIARAIERTGQRCHLADLDDTEEQAMHELIFRKARQRPTAR